MTNPAKILMMLLFLFTTLAASAQDKQQQAAEKCNAAISLMDDGKIDESIVLLKEAQALDPEKALYVYELALAHYLKEDYEEAKSLLKQILKDKDASDRFYQLLGNCYDILGNSKKALDTYDDGLKLFPGSGNLWLEKGNVYWNKKDYAGALSFYEKGIEVQPGFSSNYYRASLIYLNSTEEIWGMIYGELFINLERNSKRTTEMSKLLYETYKREIKITSDTSISVSFSRNATISLADLKSKDFKLPFGVAVYEPTLSLSLVGEKTIDLNSLSRVRTKFLETYFEKKYNDLYPNILFDYQNKLLKSGHLDAYNHWLLMKGDEKAFVEWRESNVVDWDAFVKWFEKNSLGIDQNNKFLSKQYQ